MARNNAPPTLPTDALHPGPRRQPPCVSYSLSCMGQKNHRTITCLYFPKKEAKIQNALKKIIMQTMSFPAKFSLAKWKSKPACREEGSAHHVVLLQHAQTWVNEQVLFFASPTNKSYSASPLRPETDPHNALCTSQTEGASLRMISQRVKELGPNASRHPNLCLEIPTKDGGAGGMLLTSAPQNPPPVAPGVSSYWTPSL